MANQPEPSITLTESELRATFTEWDRKYREDPKGFYSDVERFLAGQTIEEYGVGASLTFLGYLETIR